MKTYTFYSDSGHGWVAVKRKEIIDLGLSKEISPCSYQKGETVYLEEDCDATLFLKALKSANKEFSLREVNHDGESWIRDLAPFRG